MAKRRPGEVRDAILGYLRSNRRRPATVAEIQAAVQKALGSSVAASSVRSYLALNEGQTFERVGRGRYRLVSGR